MDFDEVVKKRKMIREYQQDRQVPTSIPKLRLRQEILNVTIESVFV